MGLVDLKKDFIKTSNNCTVCISYTQNCIKALNALDEMSITTCQAQLSTLSTYLSTFIDGLQETLENSSELETILKTYNTELNDTIKVCQLINTYISTMIELLTEMFTLITMDMEMEGFLEYESTLKTVKSYADDFADFLTDCTNLKNDSILWNQQLVNNR